MMYKAVLEDLTPPIAWRFLSRLRRQIGDRNSRFRSSTGVDLLEEKSASVRGIFMHVHKCAGTSLIAALEKYPGVVSCVARPGNFPMRAGRNRIPDAVWHSCVKFTFVRNPYARIVSAYRMFMRSSTWRQLFPTFKDFVEFLRWSDVGGHLVDEEIPIGEYVTTVGNIIHHCSSYHNPKYLLDQMDYIGRLETFDDDLGKIAQMLEIDLRVVHHMNKSSEAYDYRAYYSGATKKIVREIYQLDIERFGYSF